MTIVEHLKSDSDVFKLIVLSIGAVGLCVLLLCLVASKLRNWRRTPKRKPRPFQRPFIASNKISPTPKDGSPTFTYSPIKQWSPNRWSPSSSLNKSYTRTTPSPVKPNRFPSPPIEQQRSNYSPRLLSQVITYINQTESSGRDSPSRISPVNRVSRDNYTNPFVLDHSTTDDSTLPSLLISSDTSIESIIEKTTVNDKIDKIITMDKAVNTDHHLQDKIINNNDMKDITTKSPADSRKSRFPTRHRRDNFTLHLWSHKCPLPCVDELRAPCSPTWSNDGDILPDIDPDVSESEDNTARGSRHEGFKSASNNFSGKQGDSSRKCGFDVCVQTECTGDFGSRMKPDQKCCKISPLCSSDSTIKDVEQSKQCCCGSQTIHKQTKQCCCGSQTIHKQTKPKTHKQSKPRKLKKSSLIRSLERKLPEELEILESEPSIIDRTSFIPPKTWYSLGSLCDDDDNCESCGRNWKYDPHRNYHQRMYDSDTKLNLSSTDAVSYNDTGYTSTEEDDSSNNSADSKGVSSCEHQSSHENGSYDGDYESDDDIFHCRLVGSDELVFKPQPSISEPFAIDTYAEKEWRGNTPTAKAIRQGYAAIPRHVSCHQLRQIRGDNYCAIRATLFQALLHGAPLLDKLPEEGVPQVLRTILSSTSSVLQEWSFAGRISVNKSDVISTLEEILAFYVDEVQKCQEISSTQSKTDHLLSLFNDDTGNSEFKLLEAVKIIMLYHAVLLYDEMNSGVVVPVLVWLLFARDTSCDPRGLLRNHLNSVGDTGGLEQVEMCLLGYALGVVIQVFRPSQVSKPDFIANYPYIEDMPPFSPMVSLVAEDDRHYNIVVE